MRYFGLFLLGVWLIAQAVLEVFKVKFSYDQVLLSSMAFSSGVFLLLSVFKTIPREFGLFLLAVWLLMNSGMFLLELTFPYSTVVLSVIGGIAGLMLIFRK